MCTFLYSSLVYVVFVVFVAFACVFVYVLVVTSVPFGSLAAWL